MTLSIGVPPPVMFELYQLRYFLAVVETGSFTRAAKRSRVSQPTLSAGIQKLEAALDVQLLDRSSRRVALTSAGAQFLERTRAILSQVQLAQNELAQAAAPDVLRLGVLMTIPSSSVAPLVRHFVRSAAGARLELFEGTEQELANRLGAGQLDVALGIVRPAHRSRAEFLYEEGYSLALAAHHPLADRSVVEVAQLADEATIVRRRCEVLSETSRFWTDHNVRPPLVYRTEHDERALAMVGAGLGTTVMPDHYSAPEVVRVPLSGFNYRRRVGLIHRPGRKRPPLVQQFSQMATTHGWGSPTNR